MSPQRHVVLALILAFLVLWFGSSGTERPFHLTTATSFGAPA